MSYKIDKTKTFFYKTFFTIISLVIAFIPTELWIIAYWAIEPTGFWQKFLVLGAGIWFLGFFQLFLFCIWIYFFVVVVLE